MSCVGTITKCQALSRILLTWEYSENCSQLTLQCPVTPTPGPHSWVNTTFNTTSSSNYQINLERGLCHWETKRIFLTVIALVGNHLWTHLHLHDIWKSIRYLRKISTEQRGLTVVELILYIEVEMIWTLLYDPEPQHLCCRILIYQIPANLKNFTKRPPRKVKPDPANISETFPK